MRRCRVLTICLLLASASALVAQQPPAAQHTPALGQSPRQMAPGMSGGGTQGMAGAASQSSGGGQAMQGGMRNGAIGGGSMCDPSCSGMMEKEMKAYPMKVAYGVAFGILSLVALALLVVLEVLWIRLWSIRVARLKAEPEPKERS